MDNRSSLAAVIIIGIGILGYTYSIPAQARVEIASTQQGSTFVSTQARSQTASAQQITRFAYARLSINDQQYTWDVGGLQVPQTRTLLATIRSLGSQQRPTFVNLLNAIGNQGWELVPNSEGAGEFLFKRRL